MIVTERDGASESRTIKASEFKAKCLRLMDEVAESGEEIVITKNGRPTARLLPYRKRFGDWFGADRDRIEIIGDIISPIDLEWEAEVNPDRVANP
ncbi:MAG: type II toxin-antitoxin system Phd/YefM family antitoxin [Candidatus Aminicenantes bacterium]|nr:type II toxin-antitoxin system Phd/YefM family antitoxin [Candidatus Aminicenantes bacterium]